MFARCPTAEELERRKLVLRRAAWSVVAAAAIAALTWKAITAPDGVADPTVPGNHLSHGAVVLDSALLVFREGLEAVLVLAAFTASFVGANRALRRPVAAGAGVALAASVVTWFLAIWIIGALGGPGLDVQAATGLLAVAVLLVVMNWFFHKVYWTGWISAHNRHRRRLMGDGGAGRRVLFGLALLGFTAVYREGFEVVLFLQNLRINAGSATVLEGVGLGLALTVAVGVATFVLQHRLPYRRMLVATGVLLGFVLLVMVGESVQELQLAGWLPTHSLGVSFPGWLGLWLALFPTVEGVVAQLLAALSWSARTSSPSMYACAVRAQEARRVPRPRATDPRPLRVDAVAGYPGASCRTTSAPGARTLARHRCARRLLRSGAGVPTLRLRVSLRVARRLLPGTRHGVARHRPGPPRAGDRTRHLRADRLSEADLMGRDVVEALTFSDDKPVELAREWGVRRLGEHLSIRTRGGHEKKVVADVFPAYDDDGGLLVALTPIRG